MDYNSMKMEEKYFWSSIIALTNNSCDLVSLDFTGLEFDKEKVDSLAKSLQHNRTLLNLELHGVKNIDSNGWKNLSELFPAQLESLDLGNCELHSGNNFEYISHSLQRLNKIKELNIGNNNLKASHIAPIFCGALKSMRELTEFSLQGNQFGDSGLLEIVDCLPNTGSLRRLWFQNNQLSAEGKEKVNRILKAKQPQLKVEL